MMVVDDTVRLRILRALSGELPPAEAAEVERLAASDPALLAELERLRSAWKALGPDPAVLPRPGFATAVMARARAEGRPGGAVLWTYAPLWAKAAAIAALVAGVALGSTLMSLGASSASAAIPVATAAAPASGASNGAATAESSSSQGSTTSVTLAEDYAEALQGSFGDESANGGEVRQ